MDFNIVSDVKQLSIPTVEFDFDNPPYDPYIVGHQMLSTMLELNGLGLSAPQVGLKEKIFVMSPCWIVINPIILEISSETSMMKEGCLSFPGLYLNIKRSKYIRVQWYNEAQNLIEKKLEGLEARIFQHEFDHLNGKLFTSLSSTLSLKMALRKLNDSRKLKK